MNKAISFSFAAVGAVFSTLIASSISAHAQWLDPSEQRAQTPQAGPFWDTITDPSGLRSEQLADEGMMFIMETQFGALQSFHVPALQHELLTVAAARFRLALVSNPHNTRALYYLAYCLARLPLPGPDPLRHVREAIELLEHLRDVHPEYHAGRVAFDLGLHYSRLSDSERSIENYERALQFSTQQSANAITLSNLAETRMQNGDLDGAVRDYRQAISVARQTGASLQSVALPYFGLAVALDRAGDSAAADQTINEVLRFADHSAIRSNGVFYEPESEISYYDAVVYRAQAAQADEELRTHFTRQELDAWTRYLRLAPADDPFLDTARAREQDAQERLEELAR